jgi:hypothetical protein
MSWLATRNNNYSDCRFHIITGLNLAEELIDRIHNVKGGQGKNKPAYLFLYQHHTSQEIYLLC